MLNLRTLLILFVTMVLLVVQAQAFPGAAASKSESAAAVPLNTFNKGTVVETMNVSGYTYLQLENDGQKRWAAVPATEVKVGDEVELVAGMEMQNFQSKSLGRTFETIIFSQGVVKR
jgi:hypothetical protein